MADNKMSPEEVRKDLVENLPAIERLVDVASDSDDAVLRNKSQALADMLAYQRAIYLSDREWGTSGRRGRRVYSDEELVELSSELGFSKTILSKENKTPKPNADGSVSWNKGGIGSLPFLAEMVRDLSSAFPDEGVSFKQALELANREAVQSRKAMSAAADEVPAVQAREIAAATGTAEPFVGYSKFTSEELVEKARSNKNSLAAFLTETVDEKAADASAQRFRLIDFWTAENMVKQKTAKNGNPYIDLVGRPGDELTDEMKANLDAMLVGERAIDYDLQRQLLGGTESGSFRMRDSAKINAANNGMLALKPLQYRKADDLINLEAPKAERKLRTDLGTFTGDDIHEMVRDKVVQKNKENFLQDLPTADLERMSKQVGPNKTDSENFIFEIVPYVTEDGSIRQRFNTLVVRRSELEMALDERKTVWDAKTGKSVSNRIRDDEGNLIQEVIDRDNKIASEKAAKAAREEARAQNKARRNAERMMRENPEMAEKMGLDPDQPEAPRTDDAGGGDDVPPRTAEAAGEDDPGKFSPVIEERLVHGRRPTPTVDAQMNRNHRLANRGMSLSDLYRVALGDQATAARGAVSASDILTPEWVANHRSKGFGDVTPLDVMARNYLSQQVTGVKVASTDKGLKDRGLDDLVKDSGRVNNFHNRAITIDDLNFRNADGTLNEDAMRIAFMFGKEGALIDQLQSYVRRAGTTIRLQTQIDRMFDIDGEPSGLTYLELVNHSAEAFKEMLEIDNRRKGILALTEKQVKRVTHFREDLMKDYLRITKQPVGDYSNDRWVTGSRIARNTTMTMLGSKFASAIALVEVPFNMARIAVGTGPEEAIQYAADTFSSGLRQAKTGLETNTPVGQWAAKNGIDQDLYNQHVMDTSFAIEAMGSHSMSRFGLDNSELGAGVNYGIKDRVANHVREITGAVRGTDNVGSSDAGGKVSPFQRGLDTVEAFTGATADFVGMTNFVNATTDLVRDANNLLAKRLLIKFAPKLNQVADAVSGGWARHGSKEALAQKASKISKKYAKRTTELRNKMSEMTLEVSQLADSDPVGSVRLMTQLEGVVGELEAIGNEMTAELMALTQISSKQIIALGRQMGVPQRMMAQLENAGAFDMVELPGRSFMDAVAGTESIDVVMRQFTDQILNGRRTVLSGALTVLEDGLGMKFGRKAAREQAPFSLTDLELEASTRKSVRETGFKKQASTIQDDVMKLDSLAEERGALMTRTYVENWMSEASPEARGSLRTSGDGPFADAYMTLISYPIAAYTLIVRNGLMTKNKAAFVGNLMGLMFFEYMNSELQGYLHGDEKKKDEVMERLARFASGDVELNEIIQVLAIQGARSPIFGGAQWISDFTTKPILKAIGSDARVFSSSPMDSIAFKQLNRAYQTIVSGAGAVGSLINDGNTEAFAKDMAKLMTGMGRLSGLDKNPFAAGISSVMGGSGSLTKDLAYGAMGVSMGSQYMSRDFQHPVTTFYEDNIGFAHDQQPPDLSTVDGYGNRLPSQQQETRAQSEVRQAQERQAARAEQQAQAPQVPASGSSRPAPSPRSSAPGSPGEGLADLFDQGEI